MDCSTPGFSVHGILQARILEWVVIPFSRRSSWPKDWTWVSHMASRFFGVWAAKGCYCRFLSTWHSLENLKYNSVPPKKYYYVHECIYWVVWDKYWRSVQIKNPNLNFGTSFILCPSFLLQRYSNNITSGIRDSYFMLCWLLSHSLVEKLHVI